MQVQTKTETTSFPLNGHSSNYHALVSIEAPIFVEQNLNNNPTSKFVILVDISGSMHGPKIETVKDIGYQFTEEAG